MGGSDRRQQTVTWGGERHVRISDLPTLEVAHTCRFARPELRAPRTAPRPVCFAAPPGPALYVCVGTSHVPECHARGLLINI